MARNKGGLDMKLVLDASRMGQEQLHDYLQEMLPLPAYYGRHPPHRTSL